VIKKRLALEHRILEIAEARQRRLDEVRERLLRVRARDREPERREVAEVIGDPKTTSRRSMPIGKGMSSHRGG
jgi:hypothetical protein